MKTLTVAIIAKNEEEVLGRLLSCLGFADEIVVVDTGSKDKTVDIAKSFNAKVYNFVWCDDFSAARNFAFSKATMEFVMWLDADDVVSKNNQQKILLWKNSSDSCDTLMCKYCTAFDQNDNPTFWFFRERILKNTAAAFWQGRVHEVIAPFGKIAYSEIEVWHKSTADHTKRNLMIYRKMQREKHKFNQREMYYFARELHYAGATSSAKALFKKFLKADGGYFVDKAEALKILYEIYVKEGKNQEAVECLFKTFLHIRPRADICCLLGEHFLSLGQTENAIDWYKMALVSSNTQGFINADYQKFIPYIELCVCFDKLGDKKMAHHYHLLAKKEKPHHKAVIFNEKYFERTMSKTGAEGSRRSNE